MKRAVALALVAVALAVPLVARADEADQKREAQSLFEAGVKQAKEGNARAALASFRGAYAAYPNFRVLYNIGQLCEQTSDAACALRAYTQYLKDGGASVSQARRDQVGAEIKTLGKSVGSIALTSNADGATVTIDDVNVGRTPLAEPIWVNSGSRKVVVATKDKTIDKTVAVAAGDTVNVSLDIPSDTTPAVVAKPETTSTTPTPPPDHEGKTFPVVPWVVTGVFAAGTVVTGIFAASAYGSFQDKEKQFPVTRGALDDAQANARNLFIVTTALGAATVISGGIAAYFTLKPAPSGSAAPSVRVAAGPSSVALVGVWP
jgi:PEGA domain